jgi:NADP-dependent 3-hydroxy acid dehydrogenase YdfG
MSLNPKIGNWQGKRVWLVGASSGIGLAVARQLHALGAQVLVSARRAGPLQDFASAHPGSLALPLDVTDREAVAPGRIVPAWTLVTVAVAAAAGSAAMLWRERRGTFGRSATACPPRARP